MKSVPRMHSWRRFSTTYTGKEYVALPKLIHPLTEPRIWTGCDEADSTANGTPRLKLSRTTRGRRANTLVEKHVMSAPVSSSARRMMPPTRASS
eukprot:36071-Eustigmatos_ZCMA.PRE.1